MKEYKVVIYREGIFSSVLFGSAKLNAMRFTDFLNDYARDGWKVITMEKESRRVLLFWEREAFVVVLERG